MIRSNPTPEPSEDVEALNQRGNALRAQHRLDDAVKCYDGVLAVAPDHPRALFNRGIVLLQLGRAGEALADLDRVLEQAPDDAEAHAMRGNALGVLGLPQEALASYDRALALDPRSVEALFGSGYVLQQLDRATEALAKYDGVLGLAPDHAPTLLQRGGILLGLRRLDEALACYDRSVELEPDNPGPWLNRGNILLELSRPDDALASYDRALALDPGFADALNNRANVLQQLKRYAEAAQTYAELLITAPEYDYAMGNLLFCRLRICAWDDHAALTQRLADGVERGARVATPFVFLAASASASAQLRCARIHADHKYPTQAHPLWTGQRYRHDRIRLAYLSADLREHAISHLMAGVFETHDRRRFETTAIAIGHDVDDPMRRRLRSAFDRFLDARTQSDRDVAELLRTLEIDIAVDLMGYTTDCRPGILAHRPAPLQVNYLGFAGTMGASHIDYILADRIVIPEAAQAEYTERIAYLPETFFPAGTSPQAPGPPRSRIDWGLPPRGFVFCSFNNSYKVTPPIFSIWMRLLRSVDGSVIWLLGDSADVQANLRREAAARGVAPERLVFAPFVANADYHQRFRVADLFLDTLPYSTVTTASDALRVGLPVLTCIGTTYAGRVAASLLHALGLPELVAATLDEYEAMAMTLATDQRLLDRIVERLRRARTNSPLFDSDRFRRHLEGAYVGMWERWQRDESPASFRVAPCN